MSKLPDAAGRLVRRLAEVIDREENLEIPRAWKIDLALGDDPPEP